MSGSNGQRALFANAPILPAPQNIPTVPAGSNLAAAMMGQNRPMNLQSPSLNIPLASMMAMAKGTPNPTPGNNQSGLVQQPDGTWAGTPGQPATSSAQPYAGPPLTMAQENIPQQALAPGMPGAGTVGMPSVGAVGMPSSPAPGMPSMGAVGTPSVDQPGLFGQTMNWLQNLYGGQSGGGSGNVGGGG